MEICDIIADTDEGPKDAVKAIRKRLMTNAGKNYTVVMYTLTVLETCVKNCGRRFHLVVSQKDFVQDLFKLIGPKNDPPTAVQEKVLSLIQNWAAAFRSNPEMQGVVQVYNDLKAKGVEFPAADLETMVPIHTPQRSVLPQTDSRVSSVSSVRMTGSAMHGELLPSTPIPLNREQTTKLLQEFVAVRRNMQVFSEMLSDLEPGREHPRDWEFLQELQKTCHAMQTRLVDLVDKVANEEITSELLRLNDGMNSLFARYERFEKRRTAVVTGASGQHLNSARSKDTPSSPTAGAVRGGDAQASLIDFGGEDVAGATGGLHSLSLVEAGATDGSTKPKNCAGATATTSAGPVGAAGDADEFEAFAQSRTFSAKFATPEAMKTLLPDNATDFEEMERWLEAQDSEGPKTAVGDGAGAASGSISTTARSGAAAVSSPEFDRFLQERATVAERLPTIQAQAGAKEKTPKDDPNLLAQ
ncbi:target of Myb protein 1-like isoform X1 [Varroa jacobsoni]|uniref:Target of Myb protein 1 n=2 Tax=Varroa TaxID=62624 RepID=A0A7M7L2Q3_VARDE|nr:target of Myb protein 1-like isoform X1 [Varroa destructor]XP_022669333.1 target of Myb protein 1-like isoform X1 [Varroa destructor]XP_022700168.1 target of Myb protein 1-like isoform X1 [Varroa jacobsoni]XP_022700170.1 target of Myb protein 1-like isoform X1 [Varroa jacobsoni]